MDPQLVTLKQTLEKDALVSSYLPNPNSIPSDKPCELVLSIARSSQKELNTETLPTEPSNFVKLEGLSDSPRANYNTPVIRKNSTLKGKEIFEELSLNSPEGFKRAAQPFFSKYDYDIIILNPTVTKQADAILKYLTKKSKPSPSGQVLLDRWSKEFNIRGDNRDELGNFELPPIKKPFYLTKLEKVDILIVWE